MTDGRTRRRHAQRDRHRPVVHQRHLHFVAELSAPTRNAYQTIPGWAGAVMVMALLYMTTSWYFSACAPRMYYLYTPESLPYEPAPEQYWRHNPLYPPEDVPLRVDRDTAGYRLHLPE